MPHRILFVAGDPSGDHHAAGLATEVLRRDPSAVLFGYGGPALRAAGVDVSFDLPALSAVGLVDVLPRFPLAKLRHVQLSRQLRADPPDAAVLVDCGAFNLPLARVLKRLGVPVLGYFPPGSWSGSRKRATAVAAAYTAVATPFPQALGVYRELGFPAECVGHPLVDELAPVAAERAALPLDPPVIAVLPGSRPQEIRHLLLPFLQAAGRLRAERPGSRIVVSRAASAPRALFDRLLAVSGVEAEVVDGSLAAMQPATVGLVKSGTVTLEAALLGLPLVVGYRASFLAWLVAWVYLWPRPKFFAMPNILADERIVPELFQYDVTPEKLAAAARPLLDDGPERQAQLAGLNRAVAGLGGGGATARTADLLFRLLSGDSPGRA